MCIVLNNLEAQDVFIKPVSKMEDNSEIFHNGSLRRWWLLKKALTDHSLADALKLAKKAEAFITAAGEANNADGTGQGSQISPATDSESAPLAIPASMLAFEVYAFPSEEQSNFNLLESNLIQCSKSGCFDRDTRSSYLPRQTMPEPPNQAEDGEAENEEVLIPSNAVPSTFAVMASIQQVITFLRQCDDAVVSISDGQFLVNGRFRENATELFCRANRIRNRQGKPPFEVLVPNVAGSHEVQLRHEPVINNVADLCSMPRIISDCK